jgi:hypothetical protein
MVEQVDPLDVEFAQRLFDRYSSTEVGSTIALDSAFFIGLASWHRIAAEQRGREQERAAIVAWLREQDGHGYDDMRAIAIEAEEHLK